MHIVVNPPRQPHFLPLPSFLWGEPLYQSRSRSSLKLIPSDEFLAPFLPPIQVLSFLKVLPKSHSLYKWRDYFIHPALTDLYVFQTYVYGLYSNCVPDTFFLCLPPLWLLGAVTCFLILGLPHMLMTPAPSSPALMSPQSIKTWCFISFSDSKCSQVSSYFKKFSYIYCTLL